jgi:hypothetical protein
VLEIVDGLIVDIDLDGQPVGIDIQHASRHLDLSTLETQAPPLQASSCAEHPKIESQPPGAH